jgi:hypothetical protein
VCAESRLGRLTVIINPGIDGTNLRSLRDLDDGRGPVILVNCGLDRLSWLDKMGVGDYLDSFCEVYSLRRAGTGFVFRRFSGEWQLFVARGGEALEMIESRPRKPSFVEAERRIKGALGGMR